MLKNNLQDSQLKERYFSEKYYNLQETITDTSVNKVSGIILIKWSIKS